MAYYCVDNIYSKSFTPKEPNIELLDASIDHNIVVCLGNSSGKTFIASKLMQDTVNKADPNEGTLTIYVSNSSTVVLEQADCFQRLTNMTVIKFQTGDKIKEKKIKKAPGLDQILVLETQVAVFLFKNNILTMSDINLIILHDCHWILKSGLVPIKELMDFYYKSEKKPHILGLSSSLFSSESDLSLIKANLNKMEDLLDCKVETASHMLSLLRYGTHPHEMIIEYGPCLPLQIVNVIESEIRLALNFLNDHQYKPMEIYDGFKEELKNIPDPKKDPKEILLELLNTLKTLGPWCTDKAALVLLLQIEELKVATPYERHYLLLCMISSVLVKIRAILDDFFKDISEIDRIYKFSSPKILRLIEILRKFVPESIKSGVNDISDSEEESNIPRDEKTDTSKLNESFKNRNTSILTEMNIPNKNYNFDYNSKMKYFFQAVQASELNVTKQKLLESDKIINVIEEKNYVYKNTQIITKSNCVSSSQEYLNNYCDTNNSFHINVNDKNCINSKIYLSVDNSATLDLKKKAISHFLQSGCLPENKEKLNNGKNVKEFSNSDISSIGNNFQYNEYLFLQKFKVDKHTNFQYFSSPNHFKNDFSQDEPLLKQIKANGDGDLQLCGLIFVDKKFTAKVLFHILNDLKQADEDFSFLNVQFTVGKVVNEVEDPKGAEKEHKKQELMLKKFRMRSCNLLIGTNFLEEGIDLPKCNLVIRFDNPPNYRSYFNTKERARATDSLYCLLVDSLTRDAYINNLAKYHETEAMLLEKCGLKEVSDEEEKIADEYTQLIEPFCPLLNQNCPFVNLSTAVALVNRYCAKLPSDTFTRLTPIWSLQSFNNFENKMFVCKIRLPINSPVKQEIEGCPMPTRALAKRFAAFQCCQTLHLAGELDDTLQPISKESFWMREEEQFVAGNEDLEILSINSLEPRPGTTKRRQYYYKKIADSLTDCLPLAGEQSFLYAITMALTCPLPEAQNTRGRKIHAPEDSVQGFGILIRKSIPKIGPFPIFTRSGEVQVKLQLAQSTVILTDLQIEKIVAFIHYTFTSVLRLQKYLMMFDPTASENSYFIVPTKKEEDQKTVKVDWDFLELIFEKRNEVPTFLSEDERKNFTFDPAKFEDAVVSPWYRNQDQPEYLYVAEICTNLNPTSDFPGPNFKTFEEYYLKKYNIIIQNKKQALLDVDHTSARLNFLTPRYVNRKGVALPTTSEEKKKAKRENLKQKQILIPELCDIHPFPATLWRKAVCLPCILHRINALLLADEFRRKVAAEIGIGSPDLDKDFNWKPLDFGWSLADVLKQAKIMQKQQEENNKKKKEVSQSVNSKNKNENEKECENKNENENDDVLKEDEKNYRNLIKNESSEEYEENQNWIEMGTWSNDMADDDEKSSGKYTNLNEIDDIILPKNITMIQDDNKNGINMWKPRISTSLSQDSLNSYSSTNSSWSENSFSENEECDHDSSLSSDDKDFKTSKKSNNDSKYGGFKIKFKDNNVAEAVENVNVITETKDIEDNQPWCYEESEKYSKYVNEFNENLERRKAEILNSKNFFSKEKQFDFIRNCATNKKTSADPEENILDEYVPENDILENSYGSANNVFPQLSKKLSKKLKSLPYTDIILKSLNEEEKRLKELNKKFQEEKEETNYWNRGGPFNELDDICKNFSFDDQPKLEGHPGPSPSLILQALTMSNANDGINLERLETIGDSFLKYAITTYLYCTYENVHEGKLSHLRSKQVSNYNLYRLGRKKNLGESMIATKFEPHDNWLPPCYYVPRELERALIEAGVPANHWNRADLPCLKDLTKEEICQLVREKGEKLGIVFSDKGLPSSAVPCLNLEDMPYFIPYNLMTQHSIPDKSIADCVEALIGAYLVACGPRGALLFMSWLGINVLPKTETHFKSNDDPGIRKDVGCSRPVKIITDEGEIWSQTCYGELESPKKPFTYNLKDPEGELMRLLRGFDVFENSIKYRFKNRSYLLQALTHASYSSNRLTDCYQRLEFLGDAVLDYLITRHLYEDSRYHSPGALTDLRSALVNNTIFASLAVRHNFHKYFRHLCPSLNEVIDRFVRFQNENNHVISEELFLIGEDECEEVEDVEVPKALGDIFESVAGAIFLDSGMSLDAVWKVYYIMMKNEIELFSTNVPKSPIRELFELEPETAQFGKPEKLADGKRVRVTVEVFGKGLFNGIGRNYRIAKCTAAKCALKQLKQKGLLEKRK